MRTTIRTNNALKVMGRIVAIKEFGKDVAAITVAIDNGRDKEGNELKSTFVEFKSFSPATYNFAKVGMLVLIQGHLANNNYTDAKGNKHYEMNIVADTLECLESKAVVEARETNKAAKTVGSKVEAKAEEAAPAAPKKRGRKSKKAAA
jgi:single-stranded DNA-binding protein